ncbi:MAG: two-component system nitrogen regulation response regulator NtrX [Acidimicrobiales bacterium]|jgi:two-component system nitrogen regulation response regulator NtrX
MKTILIVDDEKSLRKILVDKLSQEEYTLLEAADGSACMEILETQQVDLVLLDIMMPVMDGIEVAKQIHESKKLQTKPQIVVLTNNSNMETIAAALSAHAYTYILKSDNSLSTIVETIKETLD